MKRALKRALGGAAALAAVAVPGTAAAATPDVAALRACVTRGGTLVAVDFAHWGGPIVRGCAAHQATGFDLLHAAGFTTAGDAQDGDAFICRIGNAAFAAARQFPTVDEDRCLHTPPASAYWSYWLAPAGQNHWTYSQLGPQGDAPKPGEIELWMFGATSLSGGGGSGVPRFSPASLRVTSGPGRPAAPRLSPVSPHSRPAVHAGAAAHPSTTMHPVPAPRPTAITHRSTTPAQAPATTASRVPQPAKAAAPAGRLLRRSAHPGSRAARPASPLSTAPPISPLATSSPVPPLVTAKPARMVAATSSVTPLLIAAGLVLLLGGGAARTAVRRRRFE